MSERKTNNSIIDAHELCRRNRQFITDKTICGCLHCLETFEGSAVERWTDNGTTAFCPHCGVDSVIPEGYGYPVNKEFLKKMNEYWFRPV